MADGPRLDVRYLDASQIGLFRELDRSETVDGLYRRGQGGLLLTDHSETVVGWPPGLLEKYLPRWASAARSGCPFLGALIDTKVIGLALVNPHHRDSTAQLMSLYVDRSGRRHGAASLLCQAAFDLAKKAGANCVYVSSSPTRGTVGFYWSMGFRPAGEGELDPELFTLEPNDIHMIRKL